MISDPDGNAAGDAVDGVDPINQIDPVDPVENEVTTGVKPKARARKKKVAEVSEASAPESAGEVAPELEAAKPAKKKAAKKSKPVESAAEVAEDEVPAAEPVEKAPILRKAAKKEVKAAEEPAVEVATSDEEIEKKAIAAKGPEPKLERLQKILAKAGISSRRKAEELILGGRVQINGKVVMELGTKADIERDHVRVDGKLLQGPERIRYFVLNKPKGFVTTVSDPEGRPTVMQFFASERERLYPVGRLDYLSEGLLLVTNDGELANKLTKASSGVEKTYLVKVAGQPTEEALDTLRSGVVIERGRPGTGSGRVRTAPAQIRQVRQGDNPWYEVIIIEGRNRELRKMFEEIGHHVEKIRRVGYGPLILDLEPGKLRELEPEEVQSLRLASEGKLKTRRRRGPKEAQLPTVAGKTVRYKKADGKPGFEPRAPRDYTREFSKEAKPEFRSASNPAPSRAAGFEARPAGKPKFRSENRSEGGAGNRPAGRPEFRPAGGSGPKRGFQSGGKPEFRGKPPAGGKLRYTEPPVTDYVLPPRKAGPVEPEFDEKPANQRSDFNPDYKPGFRAGAKPAFRGEGRPGSRPTGRPSDRAGSKPAFRSDRPIKPFRPAPPPGDDDFVPRSKTPGFKIEPVEDKPRPTAPRSGGFDRSSTKPFRAAGARPGGTRPAGGERPFRSQQDRPTTGNRPFRPRTDGPPTGDRRPSRGPARGDGDARTFRPRTERPESGRPFRTTSRPGADRPEGRSQTRDVRGGEFKPRREFRSGADSRTDSSERPPRFAPRGDGAPSRTSRPSRPAGAGGDRPREYRSKPAGRAGSGPAKRPFGAKPTPGGRPGTGKTGPGGEPRVKERWRNSFTGKNKGRPKPKPKGE